MSDDPSTLALLQQQHETILRLQAASHQHQLLLFTLYAYLHEQPTFDASRFGALFAEFRDDGDAAQRRHELSLRALQNLLASVEGTPH